MIRFGKYILLTVAIATVLVIAMTFYFSSKGLFADPTSSKSLADFDFSSYSFGIVAVALTFAGVYISLVQERYSEQIMRLAVQHFVPHVFGDITSLRDKCHPTQAIAGLKRTEAVKCLHAISQLSRFSSLEEAEISDLLGSDGLGSNHNNLNNGFYFFQHQKDRLIISSLGIVISVIYVVAPICYWCDSERFAASMLFAVWMLSVAEMILCLIMYTTRYGMIYKFESKFPAWSNEVELFLYSKQQSLVPDITTLQF